MTKIGYFKSKLKEPHFFKSLNMNCNSIKKVTTELIYLIQPALVLNSNVYKVGRTSKMNLERLNAYGRKSRLFLVLETKNPEELEKRILKKMNDKYTLFHGKEYFEGNINFIKDDILNEYLKL